MKKLYLLLALGMLPSVSSATDLYLGNTGSNLNNTIPGANSDYYKCQNSVPFSCQSTYIKISYGSRTGGSGTPQSPYILSSCSFVSCACSEKEYLSGKTCVSCSNGAKALDHMGVHTNTSCQYCFDNEIMYKPVADVVMCYPCPANATCNGTTSVVCAKGYYGTSGCTKCPSYGGAPGTTKSAGSTSVTKCYIPSGTTFSDPTGSGKFTADCYYKN